MDTSRVDRDGTFLAVRGLTVAFPRSPGEARVVEDVDLDVERGEIVALTGESGCGKTVTALALLRLVPAPGRIVEGSVRLAGRDVLALPPGGLRALRGGEAAMVFQEPMTALNPVLPVGVQVAEPLRLHTGAGRREARERAVAWLERVGVPSPERVAREPPHRLSGGMRQRIGIAMALAGGPSLLIADEPTTALDLTTQAAILDLLLELRSELGLAVLLITHDLALARETADRIAVMYAGRIVETGPAAGVLERPLHPYTHGLAACRPGPGARGEALPAIPGTVPPAGEWPAGCRFRPRCPLAEDRCLEEPALEAHAPGRTGRCFRAGEPLPPAAWSPAAAGEPGRLP